MPDIRIGTLLHAGRAEALIRKLTPYGFESYEITFGESVKGANLAEMAKRVRDALGEGGAIISSLGVYGNPLTGAGIFADTLNSLEQAIDHAADFGCDIVGAFAGRIPDCPVEQSIPKFKEVWSELAKRASDKGVRIAFENCPMRGDWNRGDYNIAFHPVIWEMMFDAVPAENMGLEWEPSHQLSNFVDPIPQLRKWAKKILHVHGKDATIAWDVIREYGIGGNMPYKWDRTPGFGDSNWNDIITILRMNGYAGTIDIEGYHDPVYRNELEWTGQLRALRYLKECRGGLEFVEI